MKRYAFGGKPEGLGSLKVNFDEQTEARLAPFMWNPILDTRVLIAEDLGAAPTPLALAQVEC